MASESLKTLPANWFTELWCCPCHQQQKQNFSTHGSFLLSFNARIQNRLVRTPLYFYEVVASAQRPPALKRRVS